MLRKQCPIYNFYISSILFIKYLSFEQTNCISINNQCLSLTIQKKTWITNWILCILNQRESGRGKTNIHVLNANIVQQPVVCRDVLKFNTKRYS